MIVVSYSSANKADPIKKKEIEGEKVIFKALDKYKTHVLSFL